MGQSSRSDYSYYSIHLRLFIRISSRGMFKSFVDMKNEGMSGTCRAMSIEQSIWGNQIDRITTDHKLRANNKHTRCKV